jgi:transposase
VSYDDGGNQLQSRYFDELYYNLPSALWEEGMGTDLSDAQWELIRPLLPPAKATGRPRANDRCTLNSILYVLRTGCRWKDLPERYGSSVTCWRRLDQWQEDGTWEHIWRAFLTSLDEAGKLDWSRAFLDGSFVPAKKGAADWTDSAGQGQQTDAGGGEPGLAHRRTGGQCPKSRGQAGRAYPGYSEGTEALRSAADPPQGIGSGQGLRQRPLAKPLEKERDQAVYSRAPGQKASAGAESRPGWIWAEVEGGANLRLAE